MRILNREITARSVSFAVLEELWYWIEALIGWIPGRIGRWVRVLLYWPVVPHARAVGEFTHIRKPWRLKAGRGLELGRGCELTCTGGLTIGNDVLLSPGVRIFTNNHGIELNGIPIKHQASAPAPVAIGDDVWVGAGAIVVAGICIGDGAVVAAGAVVTKDVRSETVVAGVPARAIRTRRSSAASPGSTVDT